MSDIKSPAVRFEPAPVNGGIEVWPELIKDFDSSSHPEFAKELRQDMQARHEFGVSKYGTALTVFDGRNSLVDAYQEALDLSVYLYKKYLETGDDLYRDWTGKALYIAADIKMEIKREEQ